MAVVLSRERITPETVDYILIVNLGFILLVTAAAADVSCSTMCDLYV